MTALESNLTRARKPHCCYWCRGEIKKGEMYMKVSGVEDGEFYHIALHTECDSAWHRESNSNVGNGEIIPYEELPRADVVRRRGAGYAMTVPPDRPILRYPGGKWRLAPWIISHFPVHQVYVEPFCGGASVLLRKPRSKFSEVINDLDADVVNLFRVLRSDMASELIRQVELTPFARDEFDEAHEDLEASPLERARQFLIKSHMGQSSWFFYEKNGFRSKRSMEQSPSHEWQRFPAHMRKVVKRLQGVVIESRPALEILERYDGPNVLFYVDPPYLHSVRTSRINTGSKKYRHELTDDDHVELAEALHKLQGNAIVSGYRCPLYEDLYQGWTMDQRRSMADRAVERTECIWMSPGVTLQGRLFEEAM